MNILPHITGTRAPILMASVVLSMLTACGDQSLDMDLRGIAGNFSTAEAAINATIDRPKADARGVISYPGYQVIIANHGDTLTDVANRFGLDAAKLSVFNGIGANISLRKGEIIALPTSVTEQSSRIGITSEPIDVTALAGNAINNSPDTTPVTAAELPPSDVSTPSDVEPIRHKVQRGETAFTVARLYQVSAKSLAEWNGLESDFSLREGQFLLIPIKKQNPPKQQIEQTKLEAPGEGTLTPIPPSATKPLPQNDVEVTAAQAADVPIEPVELVADVGQQTTPAKATKMAYPVTGSIIRAYSKGKNEGINIKGVEGAAVKAAADGNVAAITKSGDGIPIIVIRHPDNLLTVYANVANVKVQKGDNVQRGQAIANLRKGDNSYVHFEVRNGFDSVDPLQFLQ